MNTEMQNVGLSTAVTEALVSAFSDRLREYHDAMNRLRKLTEVEHYAHQQGDWLPISVNGERAHIRTADFLAQIQEQRRKDEQIVLFFLVQAGVIRKFDPDNPEHYNMILPTGESTPVASENPT